MATTTSKSYYDKVLQDSGLKPTTAQELQSKFDAITEAEYDQQRTELQNATNQYYNQLYNTQQTTMDTIRQANAQAVASGASRGVQAANELSALLGLQSEAITGATDLANQATTLAQDESQAMLENMLNAETQAAEQNQALANILTAAGSVDVEQQNAQTALLQVIETIKQTNPTLAEQLQTEYDIKYADSTPIKLNNNQTISSAQLQARKEAIDAAVPPSISFNDTDYDTLWDVGTNGDVKVRNKQNEVQAYVDALGITDLVNVQNDLARVAGSAGKNDTTVNRQKRVKTAFNDLMLKYQQLAQERYNIE